jgi:ribosomal protein S18 acetylase RimI-like enzyme
VTGPVVELADAEQFAPFVAAAAHVYGAAMGRPPELVVQRREIMQSHLHRTGFVAVLALEETSANDGLVGFGYGYRGRAGEWWHDVVAKALGRKAAREWMAESFELAEQHVQPDRQHQGIGREVLTRLLEVASGATVILSTHDRESAARALYRSAGFVDLLRDFVFPGSTEVYAVMGLDRRATPPAT